MSLRELKEGAIIVADAHYPHHKSQFENLVDMLLAGEIETNQLLLLGDIFDLLFGGNSTIAKCNEPMIGKLNLLSEKMEIIYLEGNHDFLLSGLFGKIEVVSLKQQPLKMQLLDRVVSLAHGDRYLTSWHYKIYTMILRSSLFIKMFGFTSRWVIPATLRALKTKNICKKKLYEIPSKLLLEQHRAECVIEGHHHQGIYKDGYYGLPAFACEGYVGRVVGGKIEYVNYLSLKGR